MNITEKCRARNILNKLSGRNLIKDPMIDELSKSKTIEDFMVSLVVKNNISYKDIPFEFCENIIFLINLVAKKPKMLDEIRETNSLVFVRIVYTYPDVQQLLSSSAIKKSTKRDIMRLLTNKSTNEKLFENTEFQPKKI